MKQLEANTALSSGKKPPKFAKYWYLKRPKKDLNNIIIILTLSPSLIMQKWSSLRRILASLFDCSSLKTNVPKNFFLKFVKSIIWTSHTVNISPFRCIGHGEIFAFFKGTFQVMKNVSHKKFFQKFFVKATGLKIGVRHTEIPYLKIDRLKRLSFFFFLVTRTLICLNFRRVKLAYLPCSTVIQISPD